MDSLRTTLDLQGHAQENLRFIRTTMARASAYAAVPGWGNVFIGLLGLVVASIANRYQTTNHQVVVWLAAAPLAASIGLWHLYRQGRSLNQALLSAPGRRFLAALAPAFGVGALLTPILYWRGSADLLPATWLLLYGVGTINAGLLSLGHLAAMGVGFILLGALALWVPYSCSNFLMGLGFGVFHIALGFLILRSRRV